MKLGLVLSGGGSRGAFEAGVIAAMEQAGLRPAVVSGTSAGALNAAGMAAGLGADSLATWWGSIADAQVYRMRRDIWRLLRPAGLLGPGNVAARLLRSVGWTWLWDIEPLRRTVIEALGGQRVPSRDDLVLAVSAVEVTSGELVRFVSARPPPERRSDRYRAVDIDVDHLLASAAVPLLFKPARVGGVLHWDGGIVANTPIAPALAFEPDAVIVVMTARRDRKRPEPAVSPTRSGATSTPCSASRWRPTLPARTPSTSWSVQRRGPRPSASSTCWWWSPTSPTSATR